MAPPQTLADYLKVAGVNVISTPAAPVAQPQKAAAAVVPVAAAPVVKAAAAPAAPAPVVPEKRASVQYDPAIIKTAQQKWLLETQGILVPDEKTAAALVANLQKTAEVEKRAELNKYAAEMEARGALQFHGMLKESTAMRLADGEATQFEVIKAAAYAGCHPSEIVARAQELKKLAEIAGAGPGSAFFGDQWARGARDGEILAASERSNASVEFKSEASAGTRAPTRGIDAAALRFQESVTIPNNPGLNHGQQTDNGKAGPA